MPGPPGRRAPPAAQQSVQVPPCAPVEAEKEAWKDYKPFRGKPTKDGDCAAGYSGGGPRPIPLAYDGYHRRQLAGELQKIDWHGLSIVPVMKGDLDEHPTTKQLSVERVNQIRLEHSINIVHSGGTEEVPKPTQTLREVPFPQSIIEVLESKDFKTPTSIQMQAWPIILKGNDFVGIAETGSGKTMAYVPPMLVHVMKQPELKPEEGPVGIVILPTRELCHQVKKEIDLFTEELGFRCTELCGGAGLTQQAEELLERVDVVVTTPGRLIHLLNLQKTNLLRATFLVLDEADTLLEGDFEEQVRLVISQIRPDRQVCLFSATWPHRVEKLAEQACNFKPIQVNVGGIKLAACKSIEQNFSLVGDHSAPFCARHCESPGLTKMQLLTKSLHLIDEEFSKGWKALVFVNTKDGVHKVAGELKASGFKCEGLSATCSQSDRDGILNRFATGHLHFLVSTSLLGRGHDFDHLYFVINFDMPKSIVDYVHRIGRCGRAGRKGFSQTLLEETDLINATELVCCLRQTEQFIPAFLQQAMHPWEQHRVRRLRDLKGGRAPPTCARDPTPTRGERGGVRNWAGRGRGVRDAFLEELQGRGLARPELSA